ncbi:ANTAR domain-containing protein [Streptomyces canus]|uniref:ANTAR domain-containing protein n=1 Tax=Streptomyces canus TaxID=58343 RepID=UPI0038667F14
MSPRPSPTAAALGLQNRVTYAQYRDLSGQLQATLSSRVRIEQAKGMLAERWSVRADRAFMALRQYGERHKRRRTRVGPCTTRSCDGEP